MNTDRFMTYKGRDAKRHTHIEEKTQYYCMYSSAAKQTLCLFKNIHIDNIVVVP